MGVIVNAMVRSDASGEAPKPGDTVTLEDGRRGTVVEMRWSVVTTPEMIEAGAAVVDEHSPVDDPAETARAVFLAMVQAGGPEIFSGGR